MLIWILYGVYTFFIIIQQKVIQKGKMVIFRIQHNNSNVPTKQYIFLDLNPRLTKQSYS